MSFLRMSCNISRLKFSQILTEPMGSGLEVSYLGKLVSMLRFRYSQAILRGPRYSPQCTIHLSTSSYITMVVFQTQVNEETTHLRRKRTAFQNASDASALSFPVRACAVTTPLKLSI